jgi:hypothetical protein
MFARPAAVGLGATPSGSPATPAFRLGAGWFLAVSGAVPLTNAPAWGCGARSVLIKPEASVIGIDAAGTGISANRAYMATVRGGLSQGLQQGDFAVRARCAGARCMEKLIGVVSYCRFEGLQLREGGNLSRPRNGKADEHAGAARAKPAFRVGKQDRSFLHRQNRISESRHPQHLIVPIGAV